MTNTTIRTYDEMVAFEEYANNCIINAQLENEVDEADSFMEYVEQMQDDEEFIRFMQECDTREA